MLLAVSHVFYYMECVHFNGISSIYALFIVHVLHIKMHRVCVYAFFSFFFITAFHTLFPILIQSLALYASNSFCSLFSIFFFFYFICFGNCILWKTISRWHYFVCNLLYIQDDHCLFTANDNLWAFCWSEHTIQIRAPFTWMQFNFLIFRHRCTTIYFISFVRGESIVFY